MATVDRLKEEIGVLKLFLGASHRDCRVLDCVAGTALRDRESYFGGRRNSSYTIEYRLGVVDRSTYLRAYSEAGGSL